MPGTTRKERRIAPRQAAPRRTTVLAGAARTRRFEHLIGSGQRLSDVRSEAAWLRSLIDEATQLSGARRVLLMLEGPDGLQLAGASVPPYEVAAALLQAVSPWLDEARRSRLGSLRHGPQGVAAVDQRSCLVVPLLAQHDMLGCLYADIDGQFGRFESADRDLLAVLASQAAMALANIRATVALEQKVAARDARLEQRAGELALINSIQQGMAAKLEFQAIVDVVGEKLREVFASKDLYVGLLDADGKTMHMPYAVEHGVRQNHSAFAPSESKVWYREVRAGRTLVARNAAEFAAYQMAVVPGTDMPSSGVYVPVMVGERYIGQVGMESFEREDAFDAAAVRLLETVASSLGTALENARLFDETQRLLQETEQRATELTVINSIQQGMSGSLDFQAIVDLVGDKLREVLHTGSVGIRWYDTQANLIRYLYEYEHGVRLEIAPNPPAPGGPWEVMVRTRRPIVANTRAEIAALGVQTIPGTSESFAMIQVPILAGDRVLGKIDLEDYERENAFGEAQIRLLTTVAASMGTALENARLFDETQRLLKETERRSSELAVINSIQQGMARELNFQAIVDLVGDKLREMFSTGDIGINWRDEQTDLIHHLYTYEHGKRLSFPPSPYRPNSKLGQALVGGQSVVLGSQAAIAAFGIKTTPGTDACLSVVFVPIHIAGETACVDTDRELRTRGRVRRTGSAPADHDRRKHGRGAAERAPVRRDAAQRARIVGAVRRRPRPRRRRSTWPP